MQKSEIIAILQEHGIAVVEEKRVNNCGDRLALSNGAIINIFDKGTIQYQGKNKDSIKQILEERQASPVMGKIVSASSSKMSPKNNRVFVVYGHDDVARAQLEAMLRRWGIEPLILDQLPSLGNTIIEKLEEYTKQVEFGIVLATPDDMGYAVKDDGKNAKCRVRQNVVLELGMLLASIGRKRVAILLKREDNFEKPSDIDGLIYIPFQKKVDEVQILLAKEMEKHNYKIDIAKL